MILESGRVGVREVTRADEGELLELVNESRELHEPWLQFPGTAAGMRAYFERYDGVSAVCLLVCALDEPGAVAGMVNLNTIVRGRAQFGTVSYAAFSRWAGRGYLSEGLGLAIRYFFDELRLHRLEANVQPG